MGLNVQWRWSMPQVGNPDQVAQGNRDSLNAGLDAIAQGILKRGENQRADAKQKWLEDTTAEKFDYQKQQDLITQMNNNRNYMLQRDQFLQNKAVQDFDMQLKKDMMDFDMQRKKDMMDFIKSRYGQMLGIGDYDPAKQEYEKLLAELKGQQQGNQAQLVMMGLNPQLMR